MPYTTFDRSKLHIKPLSERIHDMDLTSFLYPNSILPDFNHPTIDILADKIVEAYKNKTSVILMMGAHVIRSGVVPLLIKLMEKKLITHIALNGAGIIHDFELALIGASTESVAKYISEGQFGLWEETGLINEAIIQGAKEDLGLGQAIGKYVHEGDFPHKDISLLSAGYRLRVPITVHVCIGCDIIHEHPNCDGASIGQTSYKDFLIYANSVGNLEKGVFLNFGSAVIGPEVYLKCLAMARNIAHQKGEEIADFTTAVFDLLPLEGLDINETPPKSDPRYYFRPWKTIMARTVADGGKGYYVQGHHRDTVSALYRELQKRGMID